MCNPPFRTCETPFDIILPCVLDFEVTIPYVTDHNGQFKSHDLDMLRVENPQSDGGRGKRSVTSWHFPETLHLHINTSYAQFPLHLKSNDNLLAEGFAVYRRKSSRVNGKLSRLTVIEDLDHSNWCFYKGSIANMEGSSVAISVCNGLVSNWLCFLVYNLWLVEYLQQRVFNLAIAQIFKPNSYFHCLSRGLKFPPILSFMISVDWYSTCSSV